MKQSYAEVAKETGVPVHEVRSRGIAWARRNPRGKGGEFDQTFPDSFDADAVETDAIDADALIAESRAARRPADNDGAVASQRGVKILTNTSALFTAPNGVAYAVSLSDGALSINVHTPDAAPSLLEWEHGSGLNGWLRLREDHSARRAA